MRIITLCFLMFFSVSNLTFSASKALFSLTAITEAPSTLAYNESASAVYSVTNNTNIARTLMMSPIRGITQITTTTNACASLFTLQPGGSCLLNLRLLGSQLPPQLTTGPLICQVASGTSNINPYLCSQPNATESFSLSVTNTEVITGNTWISVLVAQDAPPTDIKTYVQNIHTLAPAAEQVHLRLRPIESPTVGPASTPAYQSIYQNYADLSAELYTAYANNPDFQVGYHPDNSKGSVADWGCTSGTGDWECVLNNTLIVLNNINALANPTQTGQGYTIFSIEQSYLEPVDSPSLKAVKACLNPAVADPSAVCPVATIASPVVKYGDVLPSYGDSTIYGADMLDYGYPQYYNLVESLSADHGPTLVSTASDSYFPADSAANCIAGASFPYNVIDANLSGAQIPTSGTVLPLIPCFTPNVQSAPYPNPANDVFTYQSLADPVLAAAYDAYLMTQLPPISETVVTNGATVYITFSGEPEFLGSTGWTLDKINAFNQQLNTNFSVLNTLIPGIVPSTANTDNIKYAIWNFSKILENNS